MAPADRDVVVVHDAHLDGVRVCDLPRSELPGMVPGLADGLDACAGMTVIVEMKSFPEDEYFDPSQRLVHRVLALLDGRGWSDEVILSSFGQAALDVVRRDAPHVPTAALMFARAPEPERLAAVAEAGHRLAHPYDAMVDAGFVAEARRQGVDLDV